MSSALEPVMIAALDLLRRTGAKEVQIRYSDDEEPTVWFVVGTWGEQYECAAALSPPTAALRLAERVVDGGLCTHCGRATRVEVDFASELPLADHICWYVFDPENRTFRRSCEGDT